MFQKHATFSAWFVWVLGFWFFFLPSLQIRQVFKIKKCNYNFNSDVFQLLKLISSTGYTVQFRRVNICKGSRQLFQPTDTISCCIYAELSFEHGQVMKLVFFFSTTWTQDWYNPGCLAAVGLRTALEPWSCHPSPFIISRSA